MLKGRLGGRLKEQKNFIFSMVICLYKQLLRQFYYNLTTVYSKYGTFGLHIWLCFSNSKTYQIHFINNLKRHRKFLF